MADDLHYVPGDFYRICDRTGFKIRATRTRKQWNNIIVREESWEPRQPQDFVRGVRDDQTVPQPRPRQINIFVGPLASTLSQSSAAGAYVIFVTTTTRMLAGDVIKVMLDTGEYHTATIVHVPVTGQLQINPPLAFPASSGNFVLDTTAVTDLSI